MLASQLGNEGKRGWGAGSQGALRTEVWAMNHEDHHTCFIHRSFPSMDYKVPGSVQHPVLSNPRHAGLS